MKYIKKAVVIDAIQVKANNFDRICDFMGCTPEQVLNPMSDIDEFGDSRDPYLGVIIDTLEGKMQANIGDMIIKGVKGEFYPCKPDIFKATYDKAPADYKDRMKAEHYELNERANKLRSFFRRPPSAICPTRRRNSCASSMKPCASISTFWANGVH